MQSEAGWSPLATDKLRDSKYAAVLRKYLNDFSNSDDVFTFPWEWFTLSIILIWPVYNQCNEHYDVMNCLSYCYSKTGCSNFIIRDKLGNIYLLQILTTFVILLKVIRFPILVIMRQLLPIQNFIFPSWKLLIRNILPVCLLLYCNPVGKNNIDFNNH